MKHIASVSFGKDSLALLIKVKELGLPLDEVIFCDIKFNDKISGEMPLMAEWIPKAEQILRERFGIEVKHLTAKKNFTEQFYTQKQKGKHIGDNYGFPYVVGAWCNGRLKLDPISNYIKSIKEPVVEYVGIAKDEPKRLERYKKLQTERHKYVTLADLGMGELDAMELCKKYDLLSPIYENSFRGGCWFCPKQSLMQLKNLWKNYPAYWQMLRDMEKDSYNTFKPNTTLKELENRFLLEESQISMFKKEQDDVS